MSNHAQALRNIALSLEPDAAQELNEAAEELARLKQTAQAIMDAANAQPGRMRDRPDYVASISCDLLCRLQEALREGKA